MIINAEFTAGQSIEEAIQEAIEFCERNNCMVRADLNNVDMLFFNGSLCGNTMEEKIDFFKKQFMWVVNNREDTMENHLEVSKTILKGPSRMSNVTMSYDNDNHLNSHR